MEYSSGGRIFISLDISRYELLGPELSGPQRLLDGAGGGGECFRRAKLLIIHHTVTARSRNRIICTAGVAPS